MSKNMTWVDTYAAILGCRSDPISVLVALRKLVQSSNDSDTEKPRCNTNEVLDNRSQDKTNAKEEAEKAIGEVLKTRRSESF